MVKGVICISRAVLSDAPRLRDIAVLAFMDDERYKQETAKPGGPPGHDSVQVHEEWIRSWDYCKCEMEGKVVAGCVVKHHGTQGEIFGLFVDPACMRQGIGSDLIQHTLFTNNHVETWYLETPDYSSRNHAFYAHNGFFLTHKTDTVPELGFGFHKYEHINEK